MKIERFLLISTIVLAVLIMARESKDYFIPSANASNTALIIDDYSMKRTGSFISLANIMIAPEMKDMVNEFELTGVSLHLSDSVWFFEPINFTPEAGVSIVADKYFYFPSSESFENTESVITITGLYKGAAVYFPVSINEIIDIVDENPNGQYALNITLKDIEQGSASYLTPCNPTAMNVDILNI